MHKFDSAASDSLKIKKENGEFRVRATFFKRRFIPCKKRFRMNHRTSNTFKFFRKGDPGRLPQKGRRLANVPLVAKRTHRCTGLHTGALPSGAEQISCEVPAILLP